ncbi:2OG-Fe(II) oxygenase, partial [Halomonas elongata]|nr:2OG-Fe(II) oxygenase [Halomonas elongata]
MNDSPRLPEARLGELIDGLVTRGWHVDTSFLPDALCGALHAELEDMTAREALVAAGIGRGDGHHLRRDVRGDAIRWLDRESQAQRRYLEAMSEL